jgi:hypothetical protein
MRPRSSRARKGPKTSFYDSSHRKARENIRRPVRQKNDPGGSNQAPNPPRQRRKPRKCPGSGRCDCPDMHGMAGGKGVVGLARARNAMSAPMDHASIRPFLVDQPFQNMG